MTKQLFDKNLVIKFIKYPCVYILAWLNWLHHLNSFQVDTQQLVDIILGIASKESSSIKNDTEFFTDQEFHKINLKRSKRYFNWSSLWNTIKFWSFLTFNADNTVVCEIAHQSIVYQKFGHFEWQLNSKTY